MRPCVMGVYVFFPLHKMSIPAILRNYRANSHFLLKLFLPPLPLVHSLSVSYPLQLNFCTFYEIEKFSAANKDVVIEVFFKQRNMETVSTRIFYIIMRIMCIYMYI